MGEIKTYSIPVKNFSLENADNSQFLKTKFFAIAEGDNLNNSNFEINGISGCKDSEDYAMKPILGSWQKEKTSIYGNGDFGGHDSDITLDGSNGEIYNTYLGEKSERPLGLILPNSAKIETYKNKQWLSFEGLIWAKYNREAVNLLKKKRKNNVSVEIEVLESHEDDRGVEVITKFTLLGVTVIGVEAGIPNACLDVMEFSKTSQYQSFVMAFSKAQSASEKTNMEFIKKDDYGSSGSLAIDLSKESASNDRWGDISKTDLRNKLLKAKNYKSIIPKAYLVAEEGWEEAPSDKLKYPIVQIKGDKVVLNINGVQSASSYLMKEKDASYFAKAKAKLNKVRKILGMEKLFGVEWNDDWGEIVSAKEPSIIKMEDNTKLNRKEMKAKLCSLFADKEIKCQAYADLKAKYEEKVGECEYAEDDKKEVCEKECELAKDEMAKAECEAVKCEKEIIELAKLMADDNDDDISEIDDEEEEYPIDTVGEHECEAALKDKGLKFISKTKSYLLGEKDGELYAVKCVRGEDKLLKCESEIKCEKLYAVIKDGGAIDKKESIPLAPIKVEFAKGFAELNKKLAKKEMEIKKCEDEKLEYKDEIAKNLAKLEELSCDNEIPEDYKKEVMSKVLSKEYSSTSDMEMQINAKLYQLNRNKFLSGTYTKKQNSTSEKYSTEAEEINAVLSKYNIKK